MRKDDNNNWATIPGFDGRYIVSRNGSVRNRSGKPVRLELSQRGYYRVYLSKNGVVQRFRVHRLVASAFIPNPNNLPQVDHINGVKTDNRAENLRWVTNKQNCNFNNKKESQQVSVVITDQLGGKSIYPSINAAAASIGVSRYGIMAVLQGTQKTTAGGITASYIRED